MADEKFLVVYVIYVSLVYTDSKKTASCLLSRHTIFEGEEGVKWELGLALF